MRTVGRGLTLLLPAIIGVTSLVGVESANAVTVPPADYSYYVISSDTNSTAKSLGCTQANRDGQYNYNSLVILDFGAQRNDGAGTYLTSNSTFWSNGTIELYAANFALGYQGCNHGSHTMRLAVGTNNDGSVTDGALGAAWENVVYAVQQNASNSGYVNVSVAGAGDWEGGYGSFSHLNGWVNGDSSGGGYSNPHWIPLYNYGSADGCPQSYGQYQNYLCTGDWYQDSNWSASWGWSVAYATPEIYYNGCDGQAAQHIQWGMISLEGATYHSNAIQFSGPLTDAGSCDTSANAYIDLWNVINNNSATAMTPYYLLQIRTA